MKKLLNMIVLIALVSMTLTSVFAEEETTGTPTEGTGTVETETQSPENDHESTHPENEVENNPLLSPGLRNIASHCKLKVSALAGESVPIVKDDFLRALNKNDIGSITVTSLPSAAEGELTVSGDAVKVGQVISGNDISKLEFIPAGRHITESGFEFTYDDCGFEFEGKVFMLSEANNAPTNRDISVGTSVSAFSDIVYHGHLPGYDPDGHDIEYMIVSYPSKGTVVLDTDSGEYRYIPKSGYTGKDSFEYVIVDEYGSYGASVQVDIRIESVNSDELYADMDDSPAYAEAIALARDGIIGGRLVGNKQMFIPEGTVTRGEFVTMLMSSAGIEANGNTVHTVFADDASIPQSMKGAIATAYELGYISGSNIDGKLYFLPDEAITRVECASIINNVLKIDTDGTVPVAAIIEGCPEDAYLAVSSLCSVSILPHDDGSLDVNLPLTREYAAKVLCNIKTFVNLSKAS